MRTNRNALVFGDAVSNSTDPLVILQRVLKDGKLGTLHVDNNNFKMAESVEGIIKKSSLISSSFFGCIWAHTLY